MTLIAAKKFSRIAMLSGTALLLAACSTPYALNVQKVDLSQPQAQGSIMVSDAKLYRREALINERNSEVAWLNELINKSKDVEFQPELLREIEVIRSFSAGLGLSFDPAAGFNYRQGRALSAAQQQVALDRLAQGEELATIRQEIALERLRFQLHQLKADLALARAKLADQKDPVNADLGKLGDVAGPAAAGAVSTPTSGAGSAPGTGDIFTRLATSIDALQKRLDTKSKAPRGTAARANPIDEFRDRQAYRDVLRTARNAASLDDLHDSEGNKLVRLNFQATMLPPKDGKYAQSYGLVDFEVDSYALTQLDKVQLYIRWIERLNREYARIDEVSEHQSSTLDDIVDRFYFELKKKEQSVTTASHNETNKKEPKKQQGNTIVTKPPEFEVSIFRYTPNYVSSIRNTLTQPVKNSQEDKITITAPKYRIPGETAYNSLEEIIGKLIQPDVIRDQFHDVDVGIFRGVNICDAELLSKRIIDGRSDVTELRKMLIYNSAINFHRRASGRLLPKNPGQQIDVPPNLRKVNDAIEQVLIPVENLIRSSCSKDAAEQVVSNWRDLVAIQLPARFELALRSPQRVAVYDVGPREQAQRLSTVARAADAMALALALNANVPNSGVNASAGIGFSRQASGKADALERVPQVVGYARASGGVEPTASQGKLEHRLPGFGWVLGPRAGIDPKGRDLTLDQALKSYDLSVDLSLPAWWPSVNLRLSTFLSPDWNRRDFASWTAGLPGGPAEVDPARKTVRVPLVVNTADLDALTDYLLGMRSARSAFIDTTYPKTVQACSATSLVALGRNLWRATGATLAGKRIGAGSISILPDMAGIEIAIDGKTLTKTSLLIGSSAELVVLTPYGIASSMIKVERSGECKDPAAAAEPKVVIASARPAPLGLCTGEKLLTLNGKGFDLVTSATLGAVAASKVKPVAKGKQLELTFATLAGVSNADSVAELALNGADGELLASKISVNTNCPK